MKNIFKREQGSITLYVLVSMLFLTMFLATTFTLSTNNEIAQRESAEKIKEIYQEGTNNIDAVYAKVKEKTLEPTQKLYEFAYTGALQTFTAPANGIYSFEMAGASGSGGNIYNTTYVAKGGKGAKIVATFTLKKGDIVDLVIGEQGSCTQATAKDGTSGGGGGGSFAFKRITSITNSNYQFTKGSIYYETLLAVAGGGGSQDCAYKLTNSTGYDGQASNYKSPNNYTAYSTTTKAGTTSSATSAPMGISQFITYDSKGAYYTRGSGKSQGGYGGGGASDDNYSYGGGWCQGTNVYQTTSWSLDTAATGTDGANTGNGYAKITWLRAG